WRQTSATQTGFTSPTYASKECGSSADCIRSTPSMNRCIATPEAASFRILKQTPPGRNRPARLSPGRFHTAWPLRRPPGPATAGVERWRSGAGSNPQIGFLHSFVAQQLLGVALHHETAGFQHVAVLGEREREHCVLLHQDDRDV